MRTAQRRFLILACAAAVLQCRRCSRARDPYSRAYARVHCTPAGLHLPITLERFKRSKARAPFELGDRLRLEVAYTGGQELYSWPGDARFEAGIENLLPGHGMVSNGSYALHIRNLFLRDVAEFAAPREEKCEGRPCVKLDFQIPAVRSGYALSAGNRSAPAPLVGSAWFDPASLDILRLEVRVDEAPPSVRIASTRETTEYMRARIGDVEFVVPGVVRTAAARSRWQRVAEPFALRPIPPLCGKRVGVLRAHCRHCNPGAPRTGRSAAAERRDRRRCGDRRQVHGDYRGWRASHRPHHRHAAAWANAGWWN